MAILTMVSEQCMKYKKENPFPIEKKLATIEWSLELLRASVTTTHTPLRTLKSMVEADVVHPTMDFLSKVFADRMKKTGE